MSGAPFMATVTLRREFGEILLIVTAHSVTAVCRDAGFYARADGGDEPARITPDPLGGTGRHALWIGAAAIDLRSDAEARAVADALRAGWSALHRFHEEMAQEAMTQRVVASTTRPGSRS